MALTANPHSALPPSAWDDTTVPALRKRLEDESRNLAKRISSSSFGTGDDSHSHYDIYDAYADPEYPRPTAIPRPSMSTGRPSISSNASATGTRSARSRALSQPRLSDRSAVAKANGSPGSPPLPRTSSPHANGAMPTRIPVARTRTASVSSHVATSNASPGSVRSESRNGVGDGHANGYAYHHASSTPDLQKMLQRSQGGQQASAIQKKSLDVDPSRPSTESDERPYEHWYRGEVSRNGGVGEYRVGRRQEMMDIANYGRKASPRVQAGLTDWQNGSLAPGRHDNRQSFHLDPDMSGSPDRVLDEAPPSGIDSDDSRSAEDPHGDTSYDDTLPRSTVTAPSETSDARPPIVRQPSEPPRTPTPTRSRTLLSAETPKVSALQPSALAQSSSSRSQASSPQPQAKRRAKSPAAASPPSSKKTRSPPVTQRRRREEDSRRSVAEYPVPSGDADMSDAIPTWTQPVPANGNWDDVVLPVVARKKGLDDHYVQADGSVQPKKPDDIHPPAPGTFGYDYSKYKPATAYEGYIPMKELGQQRRPTEEVDEEAFPTLLPSTTPSAPPSARPYGRPQQINPPSPISVTRNDHAPSNVQNDLPTHPAPFSHYAPASVALPDQDTMMTTAQIPMEVRQPQQHQQQTIDDDDGGSGGAGCCKCIIM